jgi:hypothetical protein
MSAIMIGSEIDAQTLLHRYAGQWQGVTRTWFEPGKLADESPWQGSLYPVLGGRYLQYEYTGKIMGNALEGRMLIGYNAATQQFEMAWIDSFHQSTGIMLCKGGTTSEGLSLLGSYHANDEEWGWRTDLYLPSAGQLIIRAYNITSNGEEALGVETIYQQR